MGETKMYRSGNNIDNPVIKKIAQYDFTGKRVLLVDDCLLNRTVFIELLSISSINIDTAANGREALDKFRHSSHYHYDIILMDMRMPVMDGLTASARIRQLVRSDAIKVPIIAISANSCADVAVQCAGVGINGYLFKPVKAVQLYETLSKFL